MVTTGLVHVAGEVTTEGYADPSPSIVRDSGSSRSATTPRQGLRRPSRAVSQVSIGQQSPDIAQGVDTAFENAHRRRSTPMDKQGAGDQGLMFGYACDDTPELMPLPIFDRAPPRRAAHRGPQGRHAGLPAPGRQDPGHHRIRRDDKAVRLDTVVLSTQHADGHLAGRSSPPTSSSTSSTRSWPSSAGVPELTRATAAWSTRPASS
jgi:S-adenosylmethionine synthetase